MEEIEVKKESILQINCRLRLHYLWTTWEEICTASGEIPVNVRGWVTRDSMTIRSLERLAVILGVPSHELMSPNFDPTKWPIPAHLKRGEK